MMQLDKNTKLFLVVLAVGCLVALIVLTFAWVSLDKYQYFDPLVKNRIKYNKESVIIIQPTFTETAYSKNGFYNFYNKTCAEDCLRVKMKQGPDNKIGTFNKVSIDMFKQLGYPIITDDQLVSFLKTDPSYLNQFDNVILMHNEYVTKEMFNAITNHKKVIYLFPNSLYAEITYDGDSITLIHGHGYPDQKITNGFGWKYDITHPAEYDLTCASWNFSKIENGYQLNCYPEYKIIRDPSIMIQIKNILHYNETVLKLD